MDAELSKAACLGDVEFLKKAVASRPNEYFLTQLKDSDPAKQNGNILHLAVCEGKDVFFREALQILPAQVKEVLLSQPNDQLRNPLHLLCACDKKKYSEKAAMTTVQLILDFYRSMKIMNSQHYSTVNKPWLALDKGNCTPLHLALKQTECWNDEFAVDMLSMDLDLLCTIVDDQKYSLLYLAVARRFDHFTQMILMSSCPYSVTGFRGFTPLTMLPPDQKNSDKIRPEKFKSDTSLFEP
ncbi:Alpha-latrotoxin-Lh1a [Bienertia sinuspersici]